MKIKEYEDTSKNAFARKIQTTYEAKIDKSSAQLVMDMLAKLYSQPHKAVLREYVSNAYDANVEANATKPIEVHLPEQGEKWLSVKDYGRGLDYLGIVSVFANFGTSTKRGSENLIGGFGIGSKSGLAISDAINVSSVCNGVLNKFVLERTPNGIITRFTKENEPTAEESGTTITINLGEKNKTDWDEHLNISMFNPNTILCGWSKDEVRITNTEYEDFNEHRVPDTWYFNGHEYKNPLIHKGYNLKGFLIGKVFYDMPTTIRYNKSSLESPSLIIPFDIKDIKVAYSRERIDYDDEDSYTRITNAIVCANGHTQDEYSSTIKDTSLQPYEKIRKLGNMGIDPSYIAASSLKVMGIIDKTLDEPAVFVKQLFDNGKPTEQVSISTNKVCIDTEAAIFLTFNNELPKRPLLKQFVSWLHTNSDDAFKDIKEELNSTHFLNIVATTTKGYAKMYYTNNTPCFNVQAAYNEFEKANVVTTDDLSEREFTYYDRWNYKSKTKIDAQWLSNSKCIIVHPNAKYKLNKAAIMELSKLRVPMPKVGYNDIEFITPKNKKEYDYLINLDPGTPTIDADDIADLNEYLNHWKTCPNGINVLKTAQIFRDLCTDKDFYLHNDLWSKTPFANQDYIERKMCCLSQCYCFDGYKFENKDLVTKAYSNYTRDYKGDTPRDEALVIIDHITKTCAKEIATLNQMLSDLDPLIK